MYAYTHVFFSGVKKIHCTKLNNMQHDGVKQEMVSTPTKNRVSNMKYALTPMSYDVFCELDGEKRLCDTVPLSWIDNVNIFFDFATTSTDEMVLKRPITDELMVNVWDRFCIAGANTFTFDFLKPLAVLARSFKFSECYRLKSQKDRDNFPLSVEGLIAFEKANDKRHLVGRYKDLSEEYTWNVSQEVFSILDYEITPEHKSRLIMLAKHIGCPLEHVLFNDFDIRSRKETTRCDPKSIATEEGVEFLHFTVKVGDRYDEKLSSWVFKNIVNNLPNTKVEVYTCWMCVGFRCGLASCEERVNLSRCSGCNITQYCCVEHQKQDRKRHRSFCKRHEQKK